MVVMGSRQHNFYNAVYQRTSYADLALQVQDLWLNRQRQEAVALIPDDLVLKTNLLGTPAMVRERLRVHHQAGVTTLRVATEGETLHAADQLRARRLGVQDPARRENAQHPPEPDLSRIDVDPDFGEWAP